MWIKSNRSILKLWIHIIGSNIKLVIKLHDRISELNIKKEQNDEEYTKTMVTLQKSQRGDQKL